MASGFRCLSLRAPSANSMAIWSKNSQPTSVDLAVNHRVSNLMSSSGIQCYTDKPKVYIYIYSIGTDNSSRRYHSVLIIFSPLP